MIAKVTFGGELFLRSEKEKIGYKGPLFAALPGDLIISKIRVGQGSFCIIGDDLDQVAVSPEYPVYTLDTQRIDPGYLVLVLRTQEFLTQLVGSASGNTTKRRIRPSFFESLRIPLPPLSEQRAIVASYRATLRQAGDLEREAEEIETKAAEAFETALGFDSPKPLPDRPVFVASFKDLDRWSHEGILRKLYPDARPHGKFLSQPLSTVAEIVYGIQKHPGNRPNKNPRPYLRVANVQRGSLLLDDIKMIDVDNTDFKRLRLKDGDLLFVEGNGTRENLGRVAVWRGQIGDCVHQNHLIRARLDKSQVNPNFAAHWFNSEPGRAHFFELGKTTSGLGTINSSVVRSALIPLPNLGDQSLLTATLDTAIDTARKLREQANSMCATAWTRFEAAVYAGKEATEWELATP